MKFYWVKALFIVLVRYPVHTPIRTPMYGLLLSQSDHQYIVIDSIEDVPH